ncbi:MAG: alpha/beta fold hydrolase [Bacteroidota bacterium]
MHGFCESPRVFSRLITELRPDFPIFTPTLPGHAGTSWHVHWNSLADAADWLRDQCMQAGWDRCVLIGHSLGGYIAAAFAQRHPDRLLGLGLLHSTARSDSLPRQKYRNKALRLITAQGTEAFRQAFLRTLFYQPDPAWTEQLRAITAETAPEAISALIPLMRDRLDHVAALAALPVPISYIVGKHDKLVSAAQTSEERMDLPQVEWHCLANAGHMGMYEAPQEVATAIRKLLQRAKAAYSRT